MTTIAEAKKIMGDNFIGPEELKSFAGVLSLAIPKKIPPLEFTLESLRPLARDYILVLGVAKDGQNNPLTITRLRDIFGVDPEKHEPCMYNQDWYLQEPFARVKTLEHRWYLMRKHVTETSRGVEPKIIAAQLSGSEQFPSAILSAFTFFCHYLLTGGKKLWEHDFVWCADRDSNGDQIYAGRYHDPKGINKSGFNIHRHLSIRRAYGCAPMIIS